MGLVKELGKDLIGIGIALGITTGALTGINFYTHHNISYKTENKEVLQKAEGIFAYTELTINRDNSKSIRKNSLINSRYYEDSDNDGKIERFIQWYHPLNRGPTHKEFGEEELKDNPKITEKANQEFNKELKRFR